MIRLLMKRLKQYFAPITTLLILSGISFLPGYAPILHSDDWFIYGSYYVFGWLKWVDWSDRRPLIYTFFKALLEAFGLNLRLFYLANALVIFLCAVIVFFLVKRLFPRLPYLALPVAVLFLIYPIDQTKMWLIQNYTWVIYLATLAAIYWLLDFAEKGRAWQLVAALALMILPLGAYEAQIGILLAASLLLAVFTRRISLRRRLILLLPVGVVALFVFWRVFYQPAILHIRDPYMRFHLDPAAVIDMLKRLLSALPMFLITWVQPFAYLLGLSARKVLLLLGGLIASFMLLGLWASRGSEPAWEDPVPALPETQADNAEVLPREEKKKGLVDLSKAFVLGLTLLITGYFPAILVFGPALEGDSSRSNTFAIAGGALALGALIGASALVVAQKRFQMRILILTALIPLVMSGVTQQIWNQYEARKAWAEQKHFWRAFFQTIPNLRDGATVVIVLPHDPVERPFKRLPLSDEGSLSGAIQVLYFNPTLRAMPFVPGHVDRYGFADIKPDGFHSYDGHIVPFRQAVIVSYVPGSHEVKFIEDPGRDLRLPFPVVGYDPYRYLRTDPPAAEYRWMVR